MSIVDNHAQFSLIWPELHPLFQPFPSPSSNHRPILPRPFPQRFPDPTSTQAFPSPPSSLPFRRSVLSLFTVPCPVCPSAVDSQSPSSHKPQPVKTPSLFTFAINLPQAFCTHNSNRSLYYTAPHTKTCPTCLSACGNRVTVIYSSTVS